MNTNQIDPVSAAIALAGLLFGPTLAGIVGPYAVIILSATVGAGWSLGRRDQSLRFGAAWYFLRLNATAVLVTASIATLAAKWLGVAEQNWLLAPVAIVVGAVGDDWPRIGKWLIVRAGRFFEKRTDTGEPKP